MCGDNKDSIDVYNEEDALLLEESIKYDENFSVSMSEFKTPGRYNFTFKNIIYAYINKI